MNLLILILIFVLAFRFLRTKDIFSPAAVFCFIIAAHATIFYIAGFWGLFPEVVSKTSHVRHVNYKVVGPYVLLFYLFLCFACLQISKFVDNKVKSDELTFQLSKSTSVLDYVLTKYLNSPYMFAFLLLIAFLLVCHFSQVNLYKVIYNRGVYLDIRTPTNVSINTTLLKGIHLGIALIGSLLSILTAFYLRNCNKVFSIVAGICFLYCLFITMSSMSRFSVVQCGLFTLVLYTSRKKAFDIGAIVMGCITLLVYATVMAARIEVLGNYGSFGFSAVWKILLAGSFFIKDLVYFLFYNFFGGGFVLADAFIKGSFYYPLKYKILSVSPLISFIDGFNTVERYTDVNKVVPTMPLSNFAEAYVFGTGYFILFVLLVLAIIYMTTLFWKRYHGFFAILVMSPMYFAFMKMHSYPIRSTVRLCYLSVFMCVVLGAVCSSAIRQLSLSRKQIGNVTDSAPGQ